MRNTNLNIKNTDIGIAGLATVAAFPDLPFRHLHRADHPEISIQVTPARLTSVHARRALHLLRELVESEQDCQEMVEFIDDLIVYGMTVRDEAVLQKCCWLACMSESETER